MNIDKNNLPNDSGIYIFRKKNGKILYIGKAKNIKKRVSQYFSIGSVWKQDMLQNAFKIDFIVVNNEEEALLLENNLIKKHKPPYNSLLKGDNSYIYIKITNEDFPQILMTRFKENDNSIYIGPKTKVRDLKKLLQYINNYLGYRLCGKTQFNKGKLCNYYDFKICKGWCCAKKNQICNIKEFFGYNYEQIKSEYSKIIDIVIEFFKGNDKLIENDILEKLEKAIIAKNYEWAINLRDLFNNIKKLTGKQTIEIDILIDGTAILIKQIGNYRVFIIMVIKKGKLIDLIRYKYNINEISIDQLKEKIDDEFGKVLYKKNGIQLIGYTKQISKIDSIYKIDIEKHLSNFIESYIISTSFESENLLNELLQNLQTNYLLKNYPYKIESLDISHFSGGWLSGGLSCMIGGLINKTFYRKYKIKLNDKLYKNDDYASLKEIIIKRFNLENVNLLSDDQIPDLFIIDGGKGQLNIIKELLVKYNNFSYYYGKIDFISIGKGKARKKSGKIKGEKENVYYFDSNFNIKKIQLNYDSSDQLLIKIRDEAHRFANYYRKIQMKKEW